MQRKMSRRRVARNVGHIRGEDESKVDVNEEHWPNAELAIRSSYEGALIEGLPADKSRRETNDKNMQVKDLQLYSWVNEANVPPGKSILLNDWARRMKRNEVRSRCVLKDFATTMR